jgi:isopenicillin N synthase-like dioxygenase
MSALPLIDISPLVRADAVSGDRDGAIAACAAAIDRACRESGFFRVSGHAVPPELQVRLDTLSRQFFALPDAEKQRIAMPLAGSAWRGWFPVGGELTSGKPDAKEGTLGLHAPHTRRHDRHIFSSKPLGHSPPIPHQASTLAKNCPQTIRVCWPVRLCMAPISFRPSPPICARAFSSGLSTWSVSDAHCSAA